VSNSFAHLSAEDRLRAEALADRFRELDADDPEAWALPEVEDDVPQLARFIFLRRLWLNGVLWYREPAGWFAPDPDPPPLAERENPFQAAHEAMGRILAAGADPHDLRRVARAIFVDTLFDVVHAIDEGADPSAGPGMPGWLLAEVDGDTEESTGRVLDQLSNDVLLLDPALGDDDEPEE
jgi:hypothetical protein